jgi:phosphoribosylformylglycinamidine synthase
VTNFRVAVHVTPRRGILDPQGTAVAHALQTLGFSGVADVKVGRHIVIDVAAKDREGASSAARQMCEKLLANPVTEDFEIAAVEAA